jgi:hypothetical protein
MLAIKPAAIAGLICLIAGCGSRSPSPKPADDSAATRDTIVAPPVLPETGADPAPSSVSPAPPAGDTVRSIVARAFPGAASARRSADPFPHQVITDGDGGVLGYEAFSDSAGTTSRGYAGMVPLQVFFDKRGRPVRIYLLDNSETPAYMDLIYRAGLLDTLLRYNPAKPDTVDAVTLATTSSHAIIAGVTGLAARVAAEIAAKPEAKH